MQIRLTNRIMNKQNTPKNVRITELQDRIANIDWYIDKLERERGLLSNQLFIETMGLNSIKSLGSSLIDTGYKHKN